MKLERLLVLGVAAWMLPGLALAQEVIAAYEMGLLTIQCKNAPLSAVFENIEQQAGIDLTLEDAVKSKRLTAELSALPLAMAVQRLLEGAGVNYIVMMDPHDWGKVSKIFIGAGGGGPPGPSGAAGRGVARQPPEPVDEPPMDEVDETGDPIDPTLEGQEDPNAVDGSQGQEDFAEPNDPGAFPTQPAPNYLPPAQNFPRSRFTPGLPNNQPYQGPQQPQPNPNAGGAFPYMDPFGRPIPAQPNQQQQQQQRQQQQQQQQQQRQQQQQQQE